MRVTAKVDYAVRALVELVPAASSSPTKADQLSAAQDIPVRFLLNILSELKVAKLVASKRGAEGGFWLASRGARRRILDANIDARCRSTLRHRSNVSSTGAAMSVTIRKVGILPSCHVRQQHD